MSWCSRYQQTKPNPPRDIVVIEMIEAFAALFPGAPIENLVKATIVNSWSDAK